MDFEKYTVGWVCVLNTEYVAARLFLDEEHDPPETTSNDGNNYTLGRMGAHNVVIAVLPYGEYGLSSAARVATCMVHRFPNVRINLMVGIGGGAPSRDHDIRLGDVVVGTPNNGSPAVFQYDYGKAVQDQGFQMAGQLDQPPTILRTAMATLKARYMRNGHQLSEDINTILAKHSTLEEKFQRPEPSTDRLYQPTKVHPKGDRSSCTVACGDDPLTLVVRPARSKYEDDPVIHYGTIASSNRLMKDALTRDALAARKGVLCFEMEAAGLMNQFPCVVIRGIFDYSDSHKNDEWQGFAAMMATAYAKDLLLQIAPSKIEAERPIRELFRPVREFLDYARSLTNETNHEVTTLQSDNHIAAVQHWLSPPDYSNDTQQARERRLDGTGTWFIESVEFGEWKLGLRQHLWLYGFPGCGKTILSTTILDHLQRTKTGTILAFFFTFSDPSKQTVDSLLRSLAFQLYSRGTATLLLDSLFVSHSHGQTQPSVGDLLTCVTSMLRVTEKVTIIIDALDECKTIEELLLSIRGFVSSNAQLIVTSRPEAELRREIPLLFDERNCILLDKEAFNPDLRFYIRTILRRNHKFAYEDVSKDFLREVCDSIEDRANGNFTYAALQLDNLATCQTPLDMKTALEFFPRTLSETYQKILQDIPSAIKDDTIRLLKSMVHVEKPLTLSEAVDIIVTPVQGSSHFEHIFDDPANILKLCPGFLSIVETTKHGRTVQELHLAHFSIKEYLLQLSEFRLERAMYPAGKDDEPRTDSGYASGNYEKLEQLDDTAVEPRSIVNEQEEQVPGLYSASTTYSASETSSLPPREDNGYIEDLAAALFGEVESYGSDIETLSRISKTLPDLLKGFALKLGHNLPSQMHRDVSYFVRKRRGKICHCFVSLLSEKTGSFDGEKEWNPQEQDEYRQERIGRFLEEQECGYEIHQDELATVPTTQQESDSAQNDDDADDDIDFLPHGQYHDFILGTPAYKWLVASLEREATLTRATPDLMGRIRQIVLDPLPRQRTASRRAPSQGYKATFEVDWNPLSFTNEQQYTEDPAEALERAVSLTIGAGDVQIATVGAYLSQTWPASGGDVMALIIDMVRNTADHCATSKLPDGTKLGARIERGKFVATTIGTVDSLAEAAQQFAWLGAALQSSPLESENATCVPHVRVTHLADTTSSNEVSGITPLTEIFYEIDFELSEPELSGEALTKQSWHNMFRNPVVVRGFPTLSEHRRKRYFEVAQAYGFWSMNKLAEVLRRQGKYEEAQQVHRPALPSIREVLGDQNPYTLASMRNFALVLENCGRSEEADEIWEQLSETSDLLPDQGQSDEVQPLASIATLPELVDAMFHTVLPSSEPAVPMGMTRIRWKCRCGDTLFDDFVELRPGALEALPTRLQEANETQNSNPQRANWVAHLGPPNIRELKTTVGAWIGRIRRDIHAILHEDPNSLPHHSRNPQPQQFQSQQPCSQNQHILHILLCIDRGEFSTVLRQERLHGVREDKELFLFLRDQYYKHRNLTSRFTFRSVGKLSLTKFEVDANDFAAIHGHNSYCSVKCGCLPPQERVEENIYHCSPAPEKDLGYSPAIGSRELTHYFLKPHAFHRKQRALYLQIPKRACGQLRASEDERELGWGLHFEEGWHWTTIYFVIVVILVVGGLIFGVAWSVTKGDIQSGFTIAATWMALAPLLLGYIAVRDT